MNVILLIVGILLMLTPGKAKRRRRKRTVWFRRRRRRRGSAALVSARQRRQVLQRDKYKCRYCGEVVFDGWDAHIDHVKPVSQGGKNKLRNLVTACQRCNLMKGGRTPKQEGMRLRRR